MGELSPADKSRKLVTETLELIVIGLGIAVIGCLGWMVLMPMTVGLFFYFPCAFIIDMVLKARNARR